MQIHSARYDSSRTKQRMKHRLRSSNRVHPLDRYSRGKSSKSGTIISIIVSWPIRNGCEKSVNRKRERKSKESKEDVDYESNLDDAMKRRRRRRRRRRRGRGRCDVETTHRHGRAPFAWVTSDYVTSVPCRISRLPTALSRCWDNGSIRMDHDPGLDVAGTLEINARIMIPIVLFHRPAIQGNGHVPASPDRRIPSPEYARIDASSASRLPSPLSLLNPSLPSLPRVLFPRLVLSPTAPPCGDLRGSKALPSNRSKYIYIYIYSRLDPRRFFDASRYRGKSWKLR